MGLYKGPIFFGWIPIVTFNFYNIVFNHKGNISITRNPLGEFWTVLQTWLGKIPTIMLNTIPTFWTIRVGLLTYYVIWLIVVNGVWCVLI
jgi:hypothetical protein